MESIENTSKEQEKTRAFNRKLVITVIIISIILQCALFMHQKCANVWSDEAFTILNVRKSWPELWNAIISDVLPPLYYILLKIAVSICGDHYKVYKLMSALPIIIMHVWISALVLSNKNWAASRRTGILLSLFIAATTLTSNFLTMSGEIRMYSWAMLFVTLSGIYAWLFYQSPTTKNIILFSLASLAACLTHYYAMFMAIYIFVLLMIFILKKKKKLFPRFLICCAIVILGYSWWIPIGYKQFSGVKNSFWVTFSFWSVPEYFKSIIGYNFFAEVVLIIFILGYFLSNFYSGKMSEEEKETSVFACCAFSLPFFSILLGVVLSVWIRPILLPRYIYPSLGLFWCGLFLLLNETQPLRKVFTLFLTAILCLTGLDSYAQEMSNENESGTWDTIQFVKSHIPETDILLSNNSMMPWPELAYYFPEYEAENFSDIDFSSSDETYWYFEITNLGDTAMDTEEILEQGYEIEEMYSGDFDRFFYYTLYRLSPAE
jgi:hypothetical protein